MNVLLISQCDKRALTESRRILDQFCERRGDRTWQTPITQDGLDISMEEWLAKHIAPRGAATLGGARAWIEVARALADEVAVASTQGSIYSRINGKGGRSS